MTDRPQIPAVAITGGDVTAQLVDTARAAAECAMQGGRGDGAPCSSCMANLLNVADYINAHRFYSGRAEYIPMPWPERVAMAIGVQLRRLLYLFARLAGSW